MRLLKTFTDSNLYRQVFGYDLFVSYSRLDSLDYAYKIASHFIGKGYECYIDQLSSTSPGSKLPINIKNAVKMSTAFILIGSEGAKNSDPISQEIDIFLNTEKNRPLIPINIEGAIFRSVWYSKIEGLALVDESKTNFISKMPSSEVIDRIQNSLKFTKKLEKVRKIVTIIIIITLILTGYTYWQTIRAANANKNFIQAEVDKQNAIKKTNELNDTNQSLENHSKNLEIDLVKDSINLLENIKDLKSVTKNLKYAENDLILKRRESILILDSLKQQRKISQSETDKANMNYLQAKIRDNYLKSNYSDALEDLLKLDNYTTDNSAKLSFFIEGVESCMNRNLFVEGVKLLSKIKNKFYSDFPAEFRKIHSKFLLSQVRYLLQNYDPVNLKTIDVVNKQAGCMLNKVYYYNEYRDTVINFLKNEYYLPLYSKQYLTNACDGTLFFSLHGNYVACYSKDSSVVKKINGDNVLSLSNDNKSCTEPYRKIYFSLLDENTFEVEWMTATGAVMFNSPENEKNRYSYQIYSVIKKDNPNIYNRSTSGGNNYYDQEMTSYYLKENDESELVFSSKQDGNWIYKNLSNNIFLHFDENILKKINKKFDSRMTFKISYSSNKKYFILKQYIDFKQAKAFLFDNNCSYISTLNYGINSEFMPGGKYIIDKNLQRVWVLNYKEIFDEINWDNVLSKQDKVLLGIEFEN